MARRDRDLFSSESQYRDETETFFFRVSMSRRDRDFFSSESQCRDETETFFFRVSISRRDRDFVFQSLNIEMRPRLFLLLKIDHFVVIHFEIYHIHS